MHYSTLIEGNELPLIEAERAAAGELDATTTAKIELVNYVEALQWLDDRHDGGELQISPPLMLKLHGVLMRVRAHAKLLTSAHENSPGLAAPVA